MSDGGIVQGLNDSELPMCPNGVLPPVHPTHAFRVQMINAAHGETKQYQNDNGELPEPLDKVTVALSYGPATQDRMRLYFDRSIIIDRGQLVTIESWYFHCRICGLILPAQRSVAP